ncbi:MAG: homoserine dehydrogenase [Coriobacteriaceae bacterium]|nr:homoserine dehydrogenase [Coriobacteriaceae bacterium]
MRTVSIGLVGCGTVGGGVVDIIRKHREDFRRRCGVDLEIAKVTSRTTSKLKAAGFSDEQIVGSYQEIIEDPDIDIVVELIGGNDVAVDVICDALKGDKHVVTANKAVMASHGKEVFEAAEEHGMQLGFEASVGGGIPIIAPLKHALVSNEISDVLGIVNGTTNYMLTRMSEDGLEYETALKEAQEKGFAEADPTADVEGADAAAKIAILASIAFNSRVTIDDVPTEGISHITPADFRYASDMGYVIKLLAIAHRTDGAIDVRVHPTMIPKTHQMASVDGVYNAIYVTGDAVGDTMFFGEGAGAGPAASAVVGDIIEIARHITDGCVHTLGCTCTEELPLRPIEELVCKYYIRMTVTDRPGALSETSRIFGENDVSISRMIQQRAFEEEAELIYVTHAAKEADIRTALHQLSQLDIVKEIGNLIRIEEH